MSPEQNDRDPARGPGDPPGGARASAAEPAGRRAPSLVLNVVANFAGRGWTAVVSLVFVPVYIRFLGVDAYGLIGIYASLLALLGVLDLGLSATLARQLARLSASPATSQEARDLVRTMEAVYWAVGLAIGASIVALSGPIAHRWIHTDTIPVETVRHALVIMGCVAAFEWPGALYAGALMGLERQVLLNGVRGGFATLQAVGAIAVLWLVSPTVLAYFAWQVAVMLLQALALAAAVRRSLPPTGRAAVFDLALLRKNAAFAAGMTGFAALATVLTQLDKVVLSKYLTLAAFGYYTLAFNVSTAVSTLVQPIFVAVFPRLSQVALSGDEAAETSLYHRACQLVSAVVLPAAITIVFFSREVLLLWIRNPATVDPTAPLLTAIMVGSALNATVTMPLALQLAHGWTRLSVVKNVIAVAVCVPLLLWLVGRQGAMAGAIVWIAINAGYFLLEVPTMHRRLLTGAARRWYLSDTLAPAALVTTICAVSRSLFPSDLGGALALGWIAVTWALSTAAVAAKHGMLSPATLRTYLRALTE